jgi:hypothetical protein
MISDEAKGWWADFFDRASEIYSGKEQAKTWLLDDLKIIKFGASPHSGNASTQSDSAEESEESHIPMNASHDIAEMVTAQLHGLPELRDRLLLQISYEIRLFHYSLN